MWLAPFRRFTWLGSPTERASVVFMSFHDMDKDHWARDRVAKGCAVLDLTASKRSKRPSTFFCTVLRPQFNTMLWERGPQFLLPAPWRPLTRNGLTARVEYIPAGIARSDVDYATGNWKL